MTKNQKSSLLHTEWRKDHLKDHCCFFDNGLLNSTICLIRLYADNTFLVNSNEQPSLPETQINKKKLSKILI